MLAFPDTSIVKQPSTIHCIFPAISAPILPGKPSIGYSPTLRHHRLEVKGRQFSVKTYAGNGVKPFSSGDGGLST